jgi:hypothetical protein
MDANVISFARTVELPVTANARCTLIQRAPMAKAGSAVTIYAHRQVHE